MNEVYNFSSGLSKGAKEFGFGHDFLTFKDIFQNYFVPKNLSSLVNSTEKERKSCSIRRGDVFLTRTSETDQDLGMSSVALKNYSNATFNGFTKRLRPNGKVDILPEYAGFYFRNPKFRATVSGMSSVTTRASLNNGMLDQLSIIAPPIAEQKAIADVLISLHNKIDLLQRQNKTLEQLAETLFRQWFVEEAEESWEVGTLDDIASFHNGKSRPKEIGRIPIYGGNGILGYTNVFNYSGKSIIVGRVGAYCGSLYFEDKEIWVSDNALMVNAKNKDQIHYLFYLLKRLELNSMAQGSSHPLLTQTLLKSLEIIKHPKRKIESFNLQVEQWNNKIEFNQTQIRTLTKTRDTLLPKLMSGEVRVKLSELG
ncbi:MAG: restriction endonuclease subunit S [Saprospiraceae bacterium]|nr:restriction endonuclease subunit S [Saprospiraceae bacterium]